MEARKPVWRSTRLCLRAGTSWLFDVHFLDKVVDLLFGRFKRGLRLRESILDIPDRDCQLRSGFLFLQYIGKPPCCGFCIPQSVRGLT